MKIWLLPIEPLEERYSADWLRWWPRELSALGHTVEVVLGNRLTDRIEKGEFLDAYDTHYFKATQRAEVCRLLRAGQVKAGDVFLLLDAWSPAVEALAYMRDIGGVAFKLAGVLHAGSWDPWDLLGQRNVQRWAGPIEAGWLLALDAVFVATQFHKRLLTTMRGSYEKVHVTGLPMYADELQTYRRPWAQREKLVVFPHRLAPEQAPEEFDAIRRAYEARYGKSDVCWVKSKEECRTKADYYRLLGCARVSVSTARQETWGIAMIESASLGCFPVVPDRLSYRETLDTYPYHSIEEAAALVHAGLHASAPEIRVLGDPPGAIARVAAFLEKV